MNATAKRLDGCRVLVVEDEGISALGMETLLRAEGATVIGPAEHLQLALDLASRERIDVAVVDLNLRGVMSFELLDLLRDRSVPFVITTGYMSETIPAQHQHRRVFSKPVVYPDLVAELAALRG